MVPLYLFIMFCFGATITQVEIVKIYVQKKVVSTVPYSFEPTASTSINTAVTPTTVTSGDPSFQDKMLALHNSKRALHNSSPLIWNSTVMEFAENYTEKYNCSGILEHSGKVYGENLAVGYTPEGAINAWYDEGDNYEYGAEDTYSHFTAMIWNSTSSLGCSYKYCNPVWGVYIVCSYYPAGNVVGHSSRNVFPPRQVVAREVIDQ